MRPVVAFLALASLSPSAHAEFQSGNELLAVCEDTDGYFNRGACVGYITGVADAHQNATPHVCLNSRITQGQVRDVAVRYLLLNPGRRHLPADVLVLQALLEAFPCAR
jgi:hypothetical protein